MALLAEPSSGSRTGANPIRTYRLLLGTDLGARIVRVVVFGHPTLSRPVMRLLGRDDVELAMRLDEQGWSEMTTALTAAFGEIEQIRADAEGRGGDRHS